MRSVFIINILNFQPPTCVGSTKSASRSPASWTCLEHLQMKKPWRIIIRYPNHLSWPLSTWRTSGSTVISLHMSEFLTLSLMLSPDTLWRKLIPAACVNITFFRSLPKLHDHRWGLQRSLIGRVQHRKHKSFYASCALFSNHLWRRSWDTWTPHSKTMESTPPFSGRELRHDGAGVLTQSDKANRTASTA